MPTFSYGTMANPAVVAANFSASPIWLDSISTLGPPGTGNDVTTNASNMTDLDIESYLEGQMGARSRSAGELAILTTVYCIIFVTGIIGNVSTCIVITRNNYMHTATNYYLFSLAISDVLTLILGLPPELYTIWRAYPWVFGEPFCLFKIVLSEMTSSASVLTITAFTLERYVAICHPIRVQTMSNLSRAIKIIVIIWILACATAIPYGIHSGTFVYVTHPVTKEPIMDSLQCNIKTEYFSKMKYMFQTSTFILFIIPMTLITILYVLIGVTLRRSGLVRRSIDNTPASSSPSGPSQSRRAILKMLGAAFVAVPQVCSIPPAEKRRITIIGGSSLSSRSSDDKPHLHTTSCGSSKRAQKLVTGLSTRRRRRRKKEVIHSMLVAVVVAFFICWAPFHAQRLMTAFIPDEKWVNEPKLHEIQSALFYISGVLYFVSSTVNPLLYNLMSRKYRQAFKETLCRCCIPLEERRRVRDGRGRIFSERSNTHVSGSNAAPTTKLLTNSTPSSRHAGHKHCKIASKNPPSCSLSDNTSDSVLARKWSYIKNRLMTRPDRNGRSGCRPNGQDRSRMTVNGSVSSAPSMSDSPGHAGAIKEELELEEVLVASPVLDKDLINIDGGGSKGTFL